MNMNSTHLQFAELVVDEQEEAALAEEELLASMIQLDTQASRPRQQWPPRNLTEVYALRPGASTKADYNQTLLDTILEMTLDDRHLTDKAVRVLVRNLIAQQHTYTQDVKRYTRPLADRFRDTMESTRAALPEAEKLKVFDQLPYDRRKDAQPLWTRAHFHRLPPPFRASGGSDPPPRGSRRQRQAKAGGQQQRTLQTSQKQNAPTKPKAPPTANKENQPKSAKNGAAVAGVQTRQQSGRPPSSE